MAMRHDRCFELFHSACTLANIVLLWRKRANEGARLAAGTIELAVSRSLKPVSNRYRGEGKRPMEKQGMPQDMHHTPVRAPARSREYCRRS